MKNPKIVEQIIIVLLVAVIIPFITIGFIISNVSQQSVRKELTYSAKTIAKFLGENIQTYLDDSQEKLDQMALAIPFFYYEADTQDYLQEIEKDHELFSDLKIIGKNSTLNGFVFDPSTYTIKLSSKINDENAFSAQISIGNLEKILAKRFNDKNREVFIIDIDNSLIAASVKNTAHLPKILEDLPQTRKIEEPEIYGKIKNQPIAYYKLKNPGWTVIVSTNEQLIKNTIDLARYRIILALILAAAFIFFVVGLYTSYLYTNIRQVFKGIIAISKGSYERKIHLIRKVFTPHELLFLAQEFNYMAQKISQSYSELSQKNIELARLDEFRTNLVNAISHEFRTPLTSIQGYASRLLRQDIKIDKKTQTDSIKTIKQQAEMLSRMVEDILVIPEIESFKLQLAPESYSLAAIVDESLLYVSTTKRGFKVNIDPGLKPVFVDKYRILQVLINLFENADKYSLEGTPVSVLGGEVEGKTVLMISNKSEPIAPEVLEKLFDKFVRLDGELTRTTRGTGLGLYIVKGIANAMGIDVNLAYDEDEGEFQVTLMFNESKDDAPKA